MPMNCLIKLVQSYLVNLNKLSDKIGSKLLNEIGNELSDKISNNLLEKTSKSYRIELKKVC